MCVCVWVRLGDQNRAPLLPSPEEVRPVPEYSKVILRSVAVLTHRKRDTLAADSSAICGIMSRPLRAWEPELGNTAGETEKACAKWKSLQAQLHNHVDV